MNVDKRRIQLRTDNPISKNGPIVYWMSRDQRVQDNWALLFAQELALKQKSPLIVVHNLLPQYLGGSSRQFDFKTNSLQKVEKSLTKKNIPFYLFITNKQKSAEQQLYTFFAKESVSAVVMDFNPLRIQQQWLSEAVSKGNNNGYAVYEVDAHNIIPAWELSQKQEYAAYTIRKKVHRLLPDFLTDFPRVRKHPYSLQGDTPTTDWKSIMNTGPADNVFESAWIIPGEKAAFIEMEVFLENRLAGYAEKRNDPNQIVSSNLSPYFHYGHLAPQRVAFEAQRYNADIPSQESFLEELIVRRELADNFCYYNDKYDAVEGFPDWARKSLDEHRADAREYVYLREQFEKGETHDQLWNAAQSQLLITGKMHGYMRMYWAKKILEWTSSPEDAMKIAIYLNDMYELDGRDPNGYAGIAWSIGGVHDRAWFDRPVYGKVRYMNANGAKKKFDTELYIKTWLDLPDQPQLL